MELDHEICQKKSTKDLVRQISGLVISGDFTRKGKLQRKQKKAKSFKNFDLSERSRKNLSPELYEGQKSHRNSNRGSPLQRTPFMRKNVKGMTTNHLQKGGIHNVSPIANSKNDRNELLPLMFPYLELGSNSTIPDGSNGIGGSLQKIDDEFGFKNDSYDDIKQVTEKKNDLPKKIQRIMIDLVTKE